MGATCCRGRKRAVNTSANTSQPPALDLAIEQTPVRVPIPATPTYHMRDPELQRQLANADKSAPMYTLRGWSCRAKCVHVYDGDTIHIACVMFSCSGAIGVWRLKCRMSGYNSAEMRTRDDAERVAAIRARDALCALVLDRLIHVQFHDYDKYGRVLIDVWASPSSDSSELNISGAYTDRVREQSRELICGGIDDADMPSGRAPPGYVHVNEHMISRGYGVVYNGKGPKNWQ